MGTKITRRGFLGFGLAGTAMLAATAAITPVRPAASGAARLKARPGKPMQPAEPGLHELGIASGKDGFFVVPKGYSPKKPLPLLLFLHGALGRTHAVDDFCKRAAEMGIAAVAPDSRGRSWDFVVDGTGPDAAFIDRTLAHVFARVAVDPRRIAFSGFSDGASFGLSVGLANGDLFTHGIAFSPGFMRPPGRQGKPALWVSHGTQDNILPVEASRERIVPQLKQWGYSVQYRELAGGHDVSPELSREAFRWFLGSAA